MPRQNRVTPFGDIVALPARGSLMGNRGCLHDKAGQIKRPMRLVTWIYCLLEFRGRKRNVMSPGKYTELFFLDEATALAAGHRPCAECQRARYNEYMKFWSAANAKMVPGEKLRAGMVDAMLHSERFGAGGKKLGYRARLGELPVGCFVELDDTPGQAWLVVDSGERVGVRVWGAGGYGERVRVGAEKKVTVLTPRSTVRAVRAGFEPRLNQAALSTG